MTSTPAVFGAGEGTQVASRSARRLFWARLREDRVALCGGIVIVLFAVLAVVGGPVAASVTGHPNAATYPSIMWDEYGTPRGPNDDFWFGADIAGRDVFVRTMYGARTSFVIALVAGVLVVFIGLVVGLLAGFFRGWGDTLLSRAGDVMLALPQLLIAVGIVAACGTSTDGCFHGALRPGIPLVVAIIALFGWPYVARIVRGSTLTLREREFVEASRSLGAGNLRIVFREVMPNLMGPLLVFTTLLIPQLILFEAGLTFLGLGVRDDTASWGGLLSQASTPHDAWWLMLFPGMFLLMTTLAFNLLGDGLHDALDVRAHR